MIVVREINRQDFRGCNGCENEAVAAIEVSHNGNGAHVIRLCLACLEELWGQLYRDTPREPRWFLALGLAHATGKHR